MAKAEDDHSSTRRRRASTKAATKSAMQPRRLPPDLRRAVTGSEGRPSRVAPHEADEQPKALPRSSRRSRSTPEDAGDDYEVGYGKPPKTTQFRPGQSGNPKGRPKGSRSMRELTRLEMAELIEIRDGGRTRKINKKQGLVKSLYSKALKGDVRASQLLIAFLGEDNEPDDRVRPEPTLSSSDQELLKQFLGNAALELPIGIERRKTRD